MNNRMLSVIGYINFFFQVDCFIFICSVATYQSDIYMLLVAAFVNTVLSEMEITLNLNLMKRDIGW